MKVGVLIEDLKKYDPGMEVLTYEGEEPVITLDDSYTYSHDEILIVG